MQIQKEEQRDKGPRKRKQKKLAHNKTDLEISLQDVLRQIQKEEQKTQRQISSQQQEAWPPTTTTVIVIIITITTTTIWRTSLLESCSYQRLL
jgi:CHASE3 domain sensor protein